MIRVRTSSFRSTRAARAKACVRCDSHVPSATSPAQAAISLPGLARRELLLGLTASAWLLQQSNVSAAGYQGQQCVQLDTAEAGDDCRRAGLLADAGSQEKYNSNANNKLVTSTQASVPVLDSAYAQSTLTLADNIAKYSNMSVYEKGRVAFIKELKQEGLTWVSQYARGGSARTQSARSMYIAIDALLGHLSSNGLAPLSPNKAKSVLAKLETAKQFLTEGR